MSKVCDHCKNKIDDFYIELNLGTRVIRKTLQDTEEEIVNGNLYNNAILCKDCFDKLAELLSNFD